MCHDASDAHGHKEWEMIFEMGSDRLECSGDGGSLEMGGKIQPSINSLSSKKSQYN